MMGDRKPLHTAIAAGSISLLALSFAGCIAVSREITRVPVTSEAATNVIDRGHWEVEQEWQCQPAVDFDVDRERRVFNGISAVWFEDGWELSDFDVVTVPDASGEPDRICLVGTFRRWLDNES